MNPLPRWSGLDGAKFLCVVFMVFIHSSFWLVTQQDEVMSAKSFLFPIITKTALIGLFPLSLPLTAGCGLRMYLEKISRHTGVREFSLLKLFKISLALLLLGFALTKITWGWSNPFEWDVLHFVGLSYLVIGVMLKIVTPTVFFSIGTLSLFLTGEFQTLFASSSSPLASILVGDNSGNVFWPFFPWFSTVAYGFGITHFYLSHKGSQTFNIILGAVGALLLGTSYFFDGLRLSFDPNNIWGANIFQPPILFVLGLMGFFSLTVLGSQLISRYKTFSETGIVRSFADGILWIYLIHIPVGVHAAQLYKRVLPLNVLTVTLFALLMIAFSWAVGYLSLRLSQKTLRITFAKTS